MHDEFNSWIGLGSAVFALLNQRKIRSSPVSVILITSYLIGAAILHVSIPAMFTLQVGSQKYTSAELRRAVYPDVWAMLQCAPLPMSRPLLTPNTPSQFQSPDNRRTRPLQRRVQHAALRRAPVTKKRRQPGFQPRRRHDVRPAAVRGGQQHHQRQRNILQRVVRRTQRLEDRE